MNSIAVLVYVRQSGSTVSELQRLGAGWKDDLRPPEHGYLSFARGLAQLKYGAFKSSRRGYISLDLFGSGQHEVAIKQNIYRNPGCDKAVLLPPKEQLDKFIVELNVGHWAKALMALVVWFIQKSDKSLGTKPPFKVPRMQYLDMAIAISPKPDDPTKSQSVFLVEPYLNEASEGMFRKFMTNSSATPLEMDNDEDNHCGAYLAFAQHVQYVETHGLVFVADFQGSVSTYPSINMRVLTLLLICRWKHATYRSSDHHLTVFSPNPIQSIHAFSSLIYFIVASPVLSAIWERICSATETSAPSTKRFLKNISARGTSFASGISPVHWRKLR